MENNRSSIQYELSKISEEINNRPKRAKVYKICKWCEKSYSTNNYPKHKKTKYHILIKKLYGIIEREKFNFSNSNPTVEVIEEWESNLNDLAHP